mmetsp:Transcript_9819/g.26171  ORF Transcript_9819/g.26171 Transcript_9819/m.26171 type:complete len:398 (+) Transcript_9819:33-1226(+)
MVRVALLGAGIFASEVHFGAWLPLIREGRVEIAAIWSRSQSSSETLSEKYKSALDTRSGFTSFHGEDGLDAVIDDSEIQAVCIALPISAQPRIARRCAEAGKHVLCEKPFAGDLESANALFAFTQSVDASRDGALYCVAENYRFEPALLRAQSLTRDTQRFGRVLQLALLAHVPFPAGSKYEQTAWRRESAHVGGIILDSGVHMAAALRMLCGFQHQHDSIVMTSVDEKEKNECQRENASALAFDAAATCAVALGARKSAHLPQIDSIVASAAMSNDALASLHVSFCAETRRMEVTVLGEHGCVHVERGGSLGGYVVEVTYADGAKEREEFAFGGVDAEIAAFVELCEERCGGNKAECGEEKVRRLSAREGFEDFRLIEACIRSGLSNGEKVEVGGA